MKLKDSGSNPGWNIVPFRCFGFAAAVSAPARRAAASPSITPAPARGAGHSSVSYRSCRCSSGADKSHPDSRTQRRIDTWPAA